VRSKEVRKALAIREEVLPPGPPAAAATPAAHWRGALHALAYFGVPILAVALLGARGRRASPQHEETAVAHEARLFPRSAMARYALGVTALKRGDAATARTELQAGASLAPSFEGPAKALAELDSREGNRGAEIEHAGLAVSAEPRDGGLRYLFATALARQKRLHEAEAEYREVIRLRPKFAGGYQGLGVIHKWRGSLPEAIPFFRKAAELDPNYRDAWCDLAGALATLGQTQEALAVLANYRSRHSEDAVAEDLEKAIRADGANQTPPGQ
jgi:predicted Zn-dependent protease